VAEETVKLLVKAGKTVNGSKVLVLGFTFKENVPDVRNTKVYDLVRELQEFGVKPIIYDPVADKEGAKMEYGVELVEDYRSFKPYDAVVVAVKHRAFAEEFNLDRLKELSTEPCILVDVKGMYEKDEAIVRGIVYWRM
jgi:UDP-N-acetyl-D-galactosamine dehydrogenase